MTVKNYNAKIKIWKQRITVKNYNAKIKIWKQLITVKNYNAKIKYENNKLLLNYHAKIKPRNSIKHIFCVSNIIFVINLYMFRYIKTIFSSVAILYDFFENVTTKSHTVITMVPFLTRVDFTYNIWLVPPYQINCTIWISLQLEL